MADESNNGIQLWYLPLEENAEIPAFRHHAKHPQVAGKGYVLYYTSQCPFTAKYVPLIETIAKEHGVAFQSIHIKSREDAQNAPTPVTTYALFLDGKYVTNEIISEKKFLKMIEG